MALGHWELGSRMEELKTLGAKVQVRFSAKLRIMWKNKMFNLKEVLEVVNLLEKMKGLGSFLWVEGWVNQS